MKLRLPHRLHAALVAALASVSFTTLCSGALTAAFFLGSQAFAEDSPEESMPDEPDQIAEFNIGYTDPDASPEESDKQQKIEVDQASIKTIEVGSNGGPGNNAGLLINEDEYNSSDEPALVAVAGSGQQDTVSVSEDTTSSTDFTSNSYDTGAEDFNGSDEVFEVTPAPAVQQLAVETTAQETTASTSTETTPSTGTVTGIYNAAPVSGSTGGGTTSVRQPAMVSLASPSAISMGGDPVSATPVLSGAVNGNVVITDMTGWVGYNEASRTAFVGSMGATNNAGTVFVGTTDYSTQPQWNNTWSFVVTVDAASLVSSANQTLLATIMSNKEDTGYSEGVKVAASGSNATVILTSWSNADQSQVVNVANYNNLTFVLSRDTDKNLKFTVYGDGDFTQALITKQVNGQTFGSTSMAAVTTGGLDSQYHKHKNSANKAALPADSTVGSFAVTGAAYTWGSKVTEEQLRAYYATAGTTALTWNGTGDDTTWDKSAENWLKGDTGSAFAEGSVAVFAAGNAGKTVTLGESLSSFALKFKDSYTLDLGNNNLSTTAGWDIISDKTLTLNGTGTASAWTITGGGSLTNNAHLQLGGMGNSTIGGVISGSGSIEKVGTGTLTLSGNNDLTGSFIIDEGTVKMGNVKSLGAWDDNRTIQVNAGGTLDYNGLEAAETGYKVTLHGGTLTNTGADKGSGKRQVVTNLVLTDDSFVVADNEMGIIANTYNATSIDMGGKTLEKTGADTFYLTNTTTSNGGTIKVSEGNVNFNERANDSQLGSLNSNLELAGGNVGGNKINLGTNITVTGTDAGGTVSAVIQGAYGITKAGDGSVTLSAANTYTGDTTINAGTLVASNASALGTGAVTVSAGTLDITSTSTLNTGALTMDGGTLKLAGAGLLRSESLTLGSASLLDITNVSISGTADIVLASTTNGITGDVSSLQLTGQVLPEGWSLARSGNNLVLAFTQPGLGLIWDASTNNEWSTDPTDFNWHNTDDNPGTAAFTANSNVTFVSDANAKNTTVLQENITAGAMNVQSGANVTVETNDHNLTAGINVAQGATVTFKTSGSQADADTVSGTISGAGNIYKEGNGTLVLNPTSNTNTGDLIINDGTVKVSNEGALGTVGNRDVVVNTGGTLALDSEGASSYTLDTVTLNRGSVLTLSGEGELTVGTFNLYAESALDLSKISLDRVGDYVLANVTTLNTSPGCITAGSDLIEYVSMNGLNGSALRADRLVSLHYNSENNQVKVILRLNEVHKGYYWKPTENNPDASGTWDTDPENPVWYNNALYEGVPQAFPNKKGGPGSDANAADSVYFLDAGEDHVENIVLDFPEVVNPASGAKSHPVYVRDLIIAGDGDTYNFTTKDNKQPYYINLDTNRISNYVVREGATANFEHASINSGEFDVIHICKRATSNMDDIYFIEVRSINNEGTFNITMDGLLGGEGGTASLGHTDNNGTMSILGKDNGAFIAIDFGEILNREGAKMSLAAHYIMANSFGDRYIHNEGELVFEGSDFGKLPDAIGAMYIQMPVEGSGTLQTTGSNASIMMYDTVEQNSMNLGAKLSDFSAAVTIEDTTELKAAAGATATAHFHVTSDLGEHVVMGTDTTLDLDTASQAVYTMGEVHSTTDEDKEQELIVRSGVTANVDGNVSLPDGMAQVAGGGKLTIGGATSTVGELAATGGDTAVVELNGATAEGTDLVLNAKRLSNKDSTSGDIPEAPDLRVVNTYNSDAADKTAMFNIGDRDATEKPESVYHGTLQYGVGARAASGSGMDLVIQDDYVTEDALLEAYYDDQAPVSGSVNIIVDTQHAHVVGLSDNISGPDGHRAMVVSGSGEHKAQGATNNSLEITGNGNYVYAGKLGANLDIAYTGTGSQTIEGGVDGFNGAVTVESKSEGSGTLAIQNLMEAAAVNITELTIGASDTLDLNDGSNVGTAVVTGTLEAKGNQTKGYSKLDGNLTLRSNSTYDVSAAGGTGGLNLTGALTIAQGAKLSDNDLAGVLGLGWFGTYDLAFGVTDMSSFGKDIDWTQGVDASTVFGNEAFGGRKEEFYIRYSTTGEGSTSGNVGAVYIYRIPEPATGTLSLLALAALATRRRRK